MRTITLIACLCLALGAAAARAELRTFELRHADAEALRPSVQALLGPYESVTVYRDTLVVNAGSGALERVAGLIAELDRPLRNLLISLRRRGTSDTQEAGTQVTGSAQAGDVRISTSRSTTTGSGLTVRGGSTTRTREREGGQSIRALEGSAVQIRDGQLVALARGGTWGPRIDYAELEQGFAVTARVSGETVRVDVSARDERVEDGTVRAGAVSSTVSGALGEWIWLGGARHEDEARIDGTGTHLATHSRGEDQYEIRVELSP